MFDLFKSPTAGNDILKSNLYDQKTFYDAFIYDLKHARSLVIIESPFITSKRMSVLLPIMQKLIACGVRIVVNTKPLDEHDQVFRGQAMQAIVSMQDIGVEVLMTIGHHRKLAIIDAEILWEGSLNILSQNDSCEYMRRIKSQIITRQTMDFIGIRKWC